MDGLRALAVAVVIIYHLEPGLLPGGSLGVDIFFTISGFVITRLLLEEYVRTGEVDLRSFYRRRWMRLVPALLIVCAMCAVLALTTRLAGFDGAWVSIALSATFLVNIVRATQPGSYSADTSLLAHNWSLGVEEQFYVFWPPLFLLLLRKARPRTVVTVVATLFLLPVIWRWMLWSPTAAHRIYNGTDTRADQLLAGALLAVVLASLHAEDRRLALLRLWSGRLALPALALLALMVWKIPVTNPGARTEPLYTVGFLVTAVLSAMVLAGVELRPAGFLSRVLSLAPLVWIGRDLSYGLYLWHYPLGRLMADLELGAWQAPATVLAAFGAATASHYLVERPLARRKHGHPLAEPAR